jgi:hypothetical protein
MAHDRSHRGSNFSGERFQSGNQGTTFATERETGEHGSSTVGELAGTVKERAEQLTSSAATTAREAWEATREQAQRFASTASTGVEDAWDTMRTFVRQHPYAALAGAFGLGLVCVGLCNLTTHERGRMRGI